MNFMERYIAHGLLICCLVCFLGCACFTSAVAKPLKQDTVIFREPGKYAAFPGVVGGEDDRLWVNFGWNTTRSHYGKAAGGETGHEVFFSPDKGETWIHKGEEGYKPRPSRAYYHNLGNGVLAMAAGKGHEILSKERAEQLKAKGVRVKHHKRTDNYTACYRAWAKRSTDGGESWDFRYLDLPPMKSLMPSHDPKGALCPNGTIVCPEYGSRIDDEAGGVFALRSTDGGKTWDLTTIAYDGKHRFSESTVLHVKDGRLICQIRCDGSTATWEHGFVFQTESTDCGATWSKPRRLPIWGYPQRLIKLRDGTILSTYGYRRPPYGIRACFSYDGGRTWDWKNEVILRADALPGGPRACNASVGDLGYPKTVELSDGTLFTVYYFTQGDGVTHIACMRWARDYRGPADIPRGKNAVKRPDPSLPPERIIGEMNPIRLKYGLMQSFIATEPQISAVAVRVSEKSADYPHANGLYVAIRKPKPDTWWTKFMGTSETLKPGQVQIGGWNLFEFDEPVKIEPGERYVLTVYNRDYLGGGETRLKEGLSGEHLWYLNSSPPGPDDYPNGGISRRSGTDLGFRVYGKSDTISVPKDPQ